MSFEKLNESNFLLFAAKHYDNAQCESLEEFQEDLNRFKYLKRLFNRYKETGDLKERLILNHIIILYNVFGDAATQMLFLKLRKYYECLMPFLILLNRLPEVIIGIDEDPTILTSGITMDAKIISLLRKI